MLLVIHVSLSAPHVTFLAAPLLKSITIDDGANIASGCRVQLLPVFFDGCPALVAASSFALLAVIQGRRIRLSFGEPDYELGSSFL